MIAPELCFRYQAGEGIYELFDKVMILNQGRQVYLGSPSEARAWFEELGYRSLPRQSTADYLTGCTDPNERQFAPGHSELDVPSTPEALEQAYLASKTAKKARTVLEDYKRTMETEKPDQGAFRASVADDQKHSRGRQNRARCAMLPTLSRRYPAGPYLCRSRWIQNLHRWREKRASTNPFYIKTAVHYSQMTAPGN